MDCYAGHLYDIDEASYFRFLGLIKPFISDPARYERLSQGFLAPRAITHGPVPKTPVIDGLPRHPPPPLLYPLPGPCLEWSSSG